MKAKISEMPDSVRKLAELCVKNDKIAPELYAKYDVKRGLRDLQG